MSSEQRVKKLLSKHELSHEEFEKFKEAHYHGFSINELTAAQHFAQTKGIELKFKDFEVRGEKIRIRDLKAGDFALVVAGIGAEAGKPMRYKGCPVDGCFSSVDEEGNCQNKNNPHGFQSPPFPEYTKRFYYISDGPAEQDKRIAQIRHDVNEGEPITGVWRLKGITFDNGDFYAFAGVQLTPEEIKGLDKESGIAGSTVASPDEDSHGSVEISDDEIPDFSYLDDNEEGKEEPKEIEPRIPEKLAEQVVKIFSKEKEVPKNAFMHFLDSKDATHLYEALLKEHDLKEEDGKVKADWAEED